jgi:hypothetical protein
VVDLLWETLIALALVVVILAATIFYADHEHAPWMPSAEMLKHVGWSLGAFGFGALYLYLALSGRRLEQEMPQLRRFITFSARWFVSLGISGLLFIFGIWLLWPVLRRFELTLPAGRMWTISPAGLQVALGLLLIFGGYCILELTLRKNSTGKKSKGLRALLASYALPIGMVVYGAMRLGSGLWVLFKQKAATHRGEGVRSPRDCKGS